MLAKLIFRYGSMNSSKSANLIMDLYTHLQNNKTTLVFKPHHDTRDYGIVSSRALSTKIKADLVVKETEENSMLELAQRIKPRVIFVDEVNFFTKNQIDELAKIVDTVGVTVIAYGLMTTFKGELFEGSKRLVELADVVERIRSECTRCSNEGLMNARFLDGEIQSDGETIVTGAEETYRVLCRKCYSEALNK